MDAWNAFEQENIKRKCKTETNFGNEGFISLFTSPGY